MSYKIRSMRTNVPGDAVINVGTARDALKKLEEIKNRYRMQAGTQIFANNILISEEELIRRAQKE